MQFTKEDVNLLNRVIRTLRADIKVQEMNGKRDALRDRLLRDHRDLEALRVRIKSAVRDAASAAQAGIRRRDEASAT